VNKGNYNPDDEHRYDDIINLPHHESPTRPRMPLIDRAAQFSPFAALTGYDDAVNETERFVDGRIELDVDTVAMLDEKLRLLRSKADKNPFVMLTYFVPDIRKDGGRYITVTGNVKKIDEYKKKIILQNGTEIPIREIIGISIEET
jgi:hypothetical protein